MKYVFLVLNWCFGGLIGLIGLLFLTEFTLGGVCLIAVSLLLLPPIRNAVYERSRKELSFKVRAAAISALLIASVVFVGQAQDRNATKIAAQRLEEQAQRVEAERQRNADYFKSHKGEIISSASLALSNKNYKLAIEETGKYLPVNDAELNEIHRQAINAIEEIRKAEEEAKNKLQRESKTKELLADLKSVPATDLNKNVFLYQQLVNLNPDNSMYKQKLEHYSQKVNANLEKERREQERLKKEEEERLMKFGEPPLQSAWNGSYYVVERYLKYVANDPDSITMDACTKVYHTEKGWLVGCDYRGRNVFGGMIRQSNWFTITHDQVIEMHDASAYRP